MSLIEAQRDRLEAQDTAIAALKARLSKLEAHGTAERRAQDKPNSPLPVRTVEHAPVEVRPDAKNAGSIRTNLTVAEPRQTHGLDISWDDGAPLFSVGDGDFSFRPRGRMTVDAASVSGSRFGARNISGTEARTMRMGMEGVVGRDLAYQIEVDFADSAEILSAFVTYLGHDGGNEYEISVGNRLSERGFDASTSSQNSPLMERSVVATAIRPEKGFFGLGLTAKYFGSNWHFAGQIVGDQINNPGTAGDTLTYMGRWHWNPIKSRNAALHLGYWLYFENISRGLETSGVDAYIAGHFADSLRVSSGRYPSPSKALSQGGELGFFGRPIYAYGEYGTRRLCSRLPEERCVRQNGWAITGGWFLTGERPPYVSRSGIFGRPAIAKPVGNGGLGAWEAVVRYEALDFGDFRDGGDGSALTLGINWYLNREARLMLNYALWSTNNRIGNFVGRDDGQTLTARMQFAF